MERLFIILAILVFAVAIVAVAAMAARGRREPLRMGSELDIEDEDLVIGSVGPRKSPIDRSAQVLDPRVLDLDAIELEPIRALDRTQRDAALRGIRREPGDEAMRARGGRAAARRPSLPVDDAGDGRARRQAGRGGHSGAGRASPGFARASRACTGRARRDAAAR